MTWLPWRPRPKPLQSESHILRGKNLRHWDQAQPVPFSARVEWVSGDFSRTDTAYEQAQSSHERLSCYEYTAGLWRYPAPDSLNWHQFEANYKCEIIHTIDMRSKANERLTNPGKFPNLYSKTRPCVDKSSNFAMPSRRTTLGCESILRILYSCLSSFRGQR